MKKLIIWLFFFSIFFFLSSFKPAFGVSCYSIEAGEVELSRLNNNYEPYFIARRKVYQTMLFRISKDPKEEIIDRYIYDGISWAKYKDLNNCRMYMNQWQDCIRVFDKKYLETKDYQIAGAWRYKNTSGQIETITCKGHLSTFDREIKNFGTIRLTYPTKTQASMKISADNKYLGYVVGGSWWGRFTALPDPYKINDEHNDWVYQVPEAGNEKRNAFFYRFPYPSAPFTDRPWWSGNNSCVFSGAVTATTPLPKEYTFNLSGPIFKDGEGDGSYADYGFDQMTIYSRKYPRNQIKELPPPPFPPLKQGIRIPPIAPIVPQEPSLIKEYNFKTAN